MKKQLIFIALLFIAPCTAFLTGVAHAQMFPYGYATSVATATIPLPSGTPSLVETSTLIGSPASTTYLSPAVATTTSSSSSTASSPSTQTALTSEFIQIDDLFVASDPGASTSSTLLAENPSVQMVTPSGTILFPETNLPPATCFTFAADNANPAACPIPPALASSSLYNPYVIETNSSTQLLLENRTPTTFSSFLPGDEVNVYGLYESDGSIQASILRDISRKTPPLENSGISALATVQNLLLATQNILAQSSALPASQEITAESIAGEIKDLSTEIMPQNNTIETTSPAALPISSGAATGIYISPTSPSTGSASLSSSETGDNSMEAPVASSSSAATSSSL